jgi:hypothetical protein
MLFEHDCLLSAALPVPINGRLCISRWFARNIRDHIKNMILDKFRNFEPNFSLRQVFHIAPQNHKYLLLFRGYWLFLFWNRCNLSASYQISYLIYTSPDPSSQTPSLRIGGMISKISGLSGHIAVSWSRRNLHRYYLDLMAMFHQNRSLGELCMTRTSTSPTICIPLSLKLWSLPEI